MMMTLVPLALMLASPTPPAAAPAGARRLQVVVRLDPQSTKADTVLADVRSEVHAIWDPYVDLDFAHVGAIEADSPPCAVDLVVSIVDHPRTSSPLDPALGWIELAPSGRPRNAVTVSMAVAARLVAEARWGGLPVRDLSPRFQALFISRALSRTIAHEIGHYVLRSSAHSATGLMRPRLTVADIMSPGLDQFRLKPAEVERLSLIQRAQYVSKNAWVRAQACAAAAG